MTTRRSFIASLFAATAVPSLSWADAGNPSFLAAAREPDGGFALFGLRADGSDAFRVPLAARGHAGAGHPTRPEAVAFARRPGDFALVLDCTTGATLARLTPPKGQYFNGHGTFSRDGSLLYTVENIAQTSDGVIGVWARDGWARIGQFLSGGIGPHEILRMPEADELVVANGGLVTDLATGDETRNIATMRPSLAYFSAAGTALDLVQLPDDMRRNSIRHLAVRADGLVGFAMQWQGDGGEDAPLLGLHRRGFEPTTVQAPLAEHRLMQRYAGSIAFDGSGHTVAISSPKGGIMQIFDPDTGFLNSLHRPDLCGLAVAANGMIVSDGTGGVLALRDQKLEVLTKASRSWDNHIVAL
ncbi:MAG: DUF1513 domain-containing protein [Cypionkella sp.]